MEESRGFHSQKAEKASPSKSEHETPAKRMKKNQVQVSKQQQKPTSSPPKKSIPFPTIETLEQKTITSEQIRLKGQQKLHYLKQCSQKQLSPNQIFQNYPFSSLPSFTFSHHLLRDQHGHLTATIYQDDKGIHLVQQYPHPSQSKYITVEEQQELNTLNGLAISLLNNGNIFEGNYHNGFYCGLGYELHANGNTYIGSFKEGTKHGNGTYYWFANNQTYAGEWHAGLPHGHGLYLSKDRYEGLFANGLKYGFGEEHFSNGDRYIGQYVNSVADGYGEYYWSDGSIYKGDFKQGVRHGYGIWQDQNQVFKGNYRLDKKEGFGMYRWKNKQVYKGEFRDDFREGYGELYSIGREEEKLLYGGCWAKGKRQEKGQIDENKVKQLYIFLDRTTKLDIQIEEHSKRQKKERVGHRNCIPKESMSPPHHNKYV